MEFFEKWARKIENIEQVPNNYFTIGSFQGLQ